MTTLTETSSRDAAQPVPDAAGADVLSSNAAEQNVSSITLVGAESASASVDVAPAPNLGDNSLTEASSPANPVEAASTTRNIVREKIVEHIDAAREAYKGKDYARVVRLLEKVPDVHLTPDMRAIRHHCQQLHHGLAQCDSAERHFANGEYELAVRDLEQVTEHVRHMLHEDLRDDRCEKILTESRREIVVQPAMEAAAKSLEEYDFAEIIRILEGVPKPDRTDRLIALLQKAHSNERRLKELRTEIAPKLVEAKEQLSTELCEIVIAFLKQLLAIKPNDAVAEATLEDLTQFQSQLEERNQRYQEGLAHFQNRAYQEAVDVLSSVHEDLKSGELAELLQKAESALQEVKQLTASIHASLQQCEFTDFGRNLARLDQLLANAAGTVKEGLSEEVFENALAEMARQSAENTELVAPLDTFVAAYSTDQIASMESTGGIALLQNYPQSGQALPPKLREILNNLADEPELAEKRLAVLRHAERLLGDDAARLAAWDEFLRLWNEFQSLAEQRFALKDLLVENPRVAQLESVGKELAESAATAFGSDADRPAILEKFTSAWGKKPRLIVRRVLRRIRNFMESTAWPTRAVTLITQSMLLRAAAAIVMGGLLGVGLSILWFLLVRIGGLTGIGALAFLAGMWSIFCWMVSKLLENESADHPSKQVSEAGNPSEASSDKRLGINVPPFVSAILEKLSGPLAKLSSFLPQKKGASGEAATEASPVDETKAFPAPVEAIETPRPLPVARAPNLDTAAEDAIFAQFANEPAPPVGDAGLSYANVEEAAIDATLAPDAT